RAIEVLGGDITACGHVTAEAPFSVRQGAIPLEITKHQETQVRPCYCNLPAQSELWAFLTVGRLARELGEEEKLIALCKDTCLDNGVWKLFLAGNGYLVSEEQREAAVYFGLLESE